MASLFSRIDSIKNVAEFDVFAKRYQLCQRKNEYIYLNNNYFPTSINSHIDNLIHHIFDGLPTKYEYTPYLHLDFMRRLRDLLELKLSNKQKQELGELIRLEAKRVFDSLEEHAVFQNIVSSLENSSWNKESSYSRDILSTPLATHQNKIKEKFFKGDLEFLSSKSSTFFSKEKGAHFIQSLDNKNKTNREKLNAIAFLDYILEQNSSVIEDVTLDTYLQWCKACLNYIDGDIQFNQSIKEQWEKFYDYSLKEKMFRDGGFYFFFELRILAKLSKNLSLIMYNKTLSKHIRNFIHKNSRYLKKYLCRKEYRIQKEETKYLSKKPFMSDDKLTDLVDEKLAPFYEKIENASNLIDNDH
jgi:hypothetical protein